MKEYVKLGTSFKEKLLFLFTGIISKDSITDKPRVCEFHDNPKPPKRRPGETYTHYPVQDRMGGVYPDNPRPIKPIEHKSPIGVYVQEKMPDIPFFELDNGTTKSNL